MSTSWQKHNPKSDRRGHKLTPAEKKAKEDEHEQKMKEARKKAEEEVEVLIPRAEALIKTSIEKFTKGPDAHIGYWKKLDELIEECHAVYRGNLTERSSEIFGNTVQRVAQLAEHLSKTYKEKLYARMDEAISKKEIDYYMDQLHTLGVKAHDANMMTWDEVCIKLKEVDKIQAERDAPVKKALKDKYLGMLDGLIKRIDEVDQTDIYVAYGAYLLIWADSFAIRQDHLDDPRKFSAFTVKLFGAIVTSFGGCNFGDKIFPRCPEEMTLHLRAYDDGPSTLRKYEDEFEDLRNLAKAKNTMNKNAVGKATKNATKKATGTITVH